MTNPEKENMKLQNNNKETFYSGWRVAGIVVLSFILFAFIAFIAGDLFKEGFNFDAARYDSGIEKFIENENKALKVFQSLESENTDLLIQDFLKGTLLWQENKEIIDELNTIENLPEELKSQNGLLARYSELRVTQYQLIIKALKEDTDKFDHQINNIISEIDGVIEQME
jgi:DNA-binding Lrp family transcriptional regulator